MGFAEGLSLNGPSALPRAGKIEQLVVLLHGYGSDGADLIGLQPYLADLLPGAAFVAPNAPERCDINAFGYQWFPIDIYDETSRLAGAQRAAPVLTAFLEGLWAQTGLTARETLLVGFSQGTMMSLYAGLRLDVPLMGIVGFSGALVGPEQLDSELKSRPPVCLVHGTADPIVPVSATEDGAAILRGHGLEVHTHLDAGSGHTITQDGLGFARLFIEKLTGGEAGSAFSL